MQQPSMTLRFTNVGFRQLSRLDESVQKRIIQKLEFYCSQNQPLKYAERLTDPRFGEWRFRIGEYRVLFDVEAEEIVVLAVGHGREIYR